MLFRFGDIVLVTFPFTDQQGQKQRPAVVISARAYNQARADVILMAVTSRIRSAPGIGEMLIQDWKLAGLLKPSAIKPIIFTVENAIIRKTLGRLNSQDRKALQDMIRAITG